MKGPAFKGTKIDGDEFIPKGPLLFTYNFIQFQSIGGLSNSGVLNLSFFMKGTRF